MANWVTSQQRSDPSIALHWTILSLHMWVSRWGQQCPGDGRTALTSFCRRDLTLGLPSCALEADGGPGLGTYADFLQNIFQKNMYSVLYWEVWLFFQEITLPVGSSEMADLLLLGQDIWSWMRRLLPMTEFTALFFIGLWLMNFTS